MAVISMKALLESGVHFGHRTHKWDPGMKPFIFTERNGIHIIDLQKTSKALDTAYNLVRDTVANGGTVLFVGTKRQAQETILGEATRAGMPSVTERWLGGMLTNWRTIRSRINEMERLERMRDANNYGRLTKKEILIINRQIERLNMLLSGVRTLTQVPELLFVVDVHREATAIHEANLLQIPVIAMVDTNCDPKNVDYVIPSNDDAIRAIKLIVGKIADAAVEGRGLRKDDLIAAEAERRAAKQAAEEPELAEEELLGEATLAKISSTRSVDLDAIAAELAIEEPTTDEEPSPEEAEAEEEAEGEVDAEAEAEAEEESKEDTDAGPDEETESN